jgi:hypothetical protein
MREAERDARQEIKEVDQACRQRTGKLHDEIDELEKVDAQLAERVTALETKAEAQGTAIEDLKDKDPAKGAPWYARPDYIRNLLLAIAAGITAILLAWGYTKEDSGDGGKKDGEKSKTEGKTQPND